LATALGADLASVSLSIFPPHADKQADTNSTTRINRLREKEGTDAALEGTFMEEWEQAGFSSDGVADDNPKDHASFYLAAGTVTELFRHAPAKLRYRLLQQCR